MTVWAVECGGNPAKTGELALGSARVASNKEDLPRGQKDQCWCVGLTAACTE